MSPVDVDNVVVQEYQENDRSLSRGKDRRYGITSTTSENDLVILNVDGGKDERTGLTLGLHEDLNKDEMFNNRKDESIKEACMYCGAYGGYVKRCGGTCSQDESSSIEEKSCSAVFHPLCAWFQGLYLETAITDPTFQGQQRGGLYPSGLAFTFLCEEHCPVEARGAVRIEQMALRKKYQIKELDLDQIPGRNRTKRKKKRPTPVREGPSGRSAAG
jgi:hypothetical protein